jgi:Putative zinc-finger
VNTGHDETKLLLGAYILGGLDETDRRALETHLPQCPDCRDELTAFAPLPGLLRRLPAKGQTVTPAVVEPDAPPTDPGLDRLLRQVRGRRRIRRAWLTLAAGLVLVLALGAGLTLLGRAGGTTPGGVAVTFADPGASGLTGSAVLTARPWGTSIAVSLADLTTTVPCQLQVIGADGRTELAATWGPPPNGRAQIVGATSFQPGAVMALVIVDATGQVLARAQLA